MGVNGGRFPSLLPFDGTEHAENKNSERLKVKSNCRPNAESFCFIDQQIYLIHLIGKSYSIYPLYLPL